MALLGLPPELLEHVLAFLPPPGIVCFGRTCRQAYQTIKSTNSVLWHTAFLQVFDDPEESWSLIQKSSNPTSSYDDYQWHQAVQKRYTALRAVHPNATGPFSHYGMHPEEIIETLIEILDTAKCGPTEFEVTRGIHPQVDDRRSLNLALLSPIQDPWGRLENLIHDCHVQSDDNEHPPGRPITRLQSVARRHGPRSSAACRLHILYGRTARDRLEHGAKGEARRIIYNWHTAANENEFGPFRKDGSGEIDWRVLEASASVMLRHFEMGADGRIAMPQGLYYSIPYRTLMDPTIPEDWAKVSGSWIGTYSFLDYADLFNFNMENSPRWSLEDVPETHGDLMILDLKLDMSLNDDPRLRTSLPESNDLPALCFTGTSRNFDPAGYARLLIRVIGRVSLCANGRDVRWKYIISYRGEEQWQLEGVQPGGIRSGPVYGNWTQWGHEEHAPVGAFIYVPEELCKKQDLVLVR